jgi:ATP-dependent Clp protease ATP-binding subunit ClpA
MAEENKTIEGIDKEIRNLELKKKEIQDKQDELEEKKKIEKISKMEQTIELTEEQKERAFWIWIRCNAEDHFPEAKRFLGNSDTERDFWELIHTEKEIEKNNDKDEPEELSNEITTGLMAQIIEWGYLKACEKLKKDPYWLYKSPEELRRKMIVNTAERRY